MKIKEISSIKQKMINVRRADVERLHIQGHSVVEIADKVHVDARTVSRDIQENRKKWLQIIGGSNEAREWLQGHVADTMAFFDEVKKRFFQQAETFTTESAKTRALWHAAEIEIRRMETLKTLIWSLYDLQTGGHQLRYDDDP